MREGFLKRIAIGLMIGIVVLLVSPIPMYRAESLVCKICREAGANCVCPEAGWYWLPPFAMQMYQVMTYSNDASQEEIILDPRGDLVVNENIILPPDVIGVEETVGEMFEPNPTGEPREIPEEELEGSL